MRRFFVLLFSATAIHAFLAIGLVSLASGRAEREMFEGKLPGHAMFRAMGAVAQVLFYPLLWLPRGEVTEPGTTLRFVSNSFVWGLLIAVACTLISGYRMRERSTTTSATRIE